MRLVICAAALLVSIPAISNGDNPWVRPEILDASASARLFNDARPVSTWTRSRRADPAVVALVDTVADQAGLSRAVMHDHVRRESGYRPEARNPKSTAKGLLQVLHGSHEAIVQRRMSRAEHFRLMADPGYALRVGAAHMKACADLMPGASAHALWRNCHVRGHGAVGGNIRMAAAHFTPDSGGWLARGSVAAPWANTDVRSGG